MIGYKVRFVVLDYSLDHLGYWKWLDKGQRAIGYVIDAYTNVHGYRYYRIIYDRDHQHSQRYFPNGYKPYLQTTDVIHHHIEKIVSVDIKKNNKELQLLLDQ